MNGTPAMKQWTQEVDGEHWRAEARALGPKRQARTLAKAMRAHYTTQLGFGLHGLQAIAVEHFVEDVLWVEVAAPFMAEVRGG